MSSFKTHLWFTVGFLILTVAGFYAEEDGRGIRAWKTVVADITAHGESMNWNDYIPHPVPDAQNFYQAPMMADWFTRSTNAVRVQISMMGTNSQTYLDAMDLDSASNYLAWCAAFDPVFSQIREALKRPASRINGDYTKPFGLSLLPDFVGYRTVSQVLSHRARCHLLLGQPDQALDDLTLLHGLDSTLARDGKPTTLVTAMVHVAITGLYVNVVDCGLNSHGWRESDLMAIQKQLAKIHLLPQLIYAFQAERAGSCYLIDQSVDQLLTECVDSGHITGQGLGFILPGGWIDQNKALVASIEEQMMESVNPANGTVSPLKAMATSRRLDNTFQHTTPWNFIAAICIPNFSKAAETTARNQTWADHARVVCALERCRLANGKYPATLATLVPEFLDRIPTDVVNGKPVSYLHKDDQTFTLYSVGWNETDEGGLIARKSDGTEDSDHGDWVWHYPEP